MRGAAAQLEAPRVIDGGFDAEHPAGFVVHLERVLLHAVPDAHAFAPAFERARDFSVRAGAKASPQKPQDVRGVKGVDRVARQLWIKRGQIGGVVKDDIGRIFTLPLAPVVRTQIPPAPPIQPGHYAARPPGQQCRPLASGQLVAGALRAGKIGDRSEAIIHLHIAWTPLRVRRRASHSRPLT